MNFGKYLKTKMAEEAEATTNLSGRLLTTEKFTLYGNIMVESHVYISATGSSYSVKQRS